MHPEAKSLFRRYQDTFLLKAVIRAFRIASGFLPVWFMRASAFFIIIIFIALNLENFSAVMKNLRRIKPDRNIIKLIYSAYSIFLNYAFYLIDLFYLSHDGKRIREYLIHNTGSKNLSGFSPANQGFILLTLHMGNWEIAGTSISTQTGIIPHIVYSPDTENTIESLRKTFRELHHLIDIPLSGGNFFALRLYNILRNGGVVAFQGDRLLGDSGIEMEFFKEQAFFPKGPVILGMVSGLPILPVFSVLKGYKKYEIFIEEPYTVKIYSTRDETIQMALKDIIAIYEKYLSRYPEQWFTFMPFWVRDRQSD
jgi:KDO2-lipid IV(A) lauroyltransferase